MFRAPSPDFKLALSSCGLKIEGTDQDEGNNHVIFEVITAVCCATDDGPMKSVLEELTKPDIIVPQATATQLATLNDYFDLKPENIEKTIAVTKTVSGSTEKLLRQVNSLELGVKRRLQVEELESTSKKYKHYAGNRI